MNSAKSVNGWQRIIPSSHPVSNGASAMSWRTSPVGPKVRRAPPGAKMCEFVPLGHYPYKIFYRLSTDTVEILHIHHAARRPWDEQA